MVDLRAELSSRGLPTKGVKAELVERLKEDDAAQPEEPKPELEGKAAVDEAAPPTDDGPAQEATEAEQAVKESPPFIESNAPVNENATTQPEVAVTHTPAATLQPTTEDANAAPPIDNNLPRLPTTEPPSDLAADLQKRKRRSSTPPPSAKRARQEDERRVEENEDLVDFETGDISNSPQKKSQNGVGKTEKVEEKIQGEDQGDPMQDVLPNKPAVADEIPRDALEISGEDAYAKRVAIAESSKALSTSSAHAQDASTGVRGEGVDAEPEAAAISSKPPQSPQAQAPMPEVSGEDAFMKRVAIGRPSAAPQHTSQPAESERDDRQHDAPEQPQGELPDENGSASLPSTHPPTRALYIRELMRPLKSEMVEQYIVEVIAPPGSKPDPKIIENFYLDQIRTHAFVVLTTVSAAQRLRAELHNQVWPNERNRKPLWVDFVPSHQVKDWIEREESAPRAHSRRWEVVYEQDGRDVSAVHREIGSDRKPSFSRPPPTGPAAAGPVYPGIEAAPRGPRGRGGRPPGESPTVPGSLQTQAQPRLSYTPLGEDVAQRRVANMRTFYSHDPPSDLGKDYHRFTFENVDSFVDRGREVFIGIRPPHRQREHEERVRRGTAGASSVAESRRDDYRPPPRPAFTDEDRFSRHDEGRLSRHDGNRRSDWPPRDRGYRGGRGSRRFQGEDPYRYRPGY